MRPAGSGSNTIRVLHVSAGNLFGGVESMLVTLARHRESCPGLRPEFAVCFEGRLAGELRQAGATVHILGHVRFRCPWTIWQRRRTLAHLLRQQRYDRVICHSVWPQALFAPVARRAGVPLVCWLHDATTGQHWLERLAARTAPDLVVCNSRYTAATLPNLYPGVRAEVVYCPVAAPESSRPALDRFRVRAELRTPKDAVVIVQSSRLEEWKGHALHLEALGLLSDLPGWVCWVAGGAQRRHEVHYLHRLQALAARLGIAERVRFLGQRSDVAGLLAAADIHCQPNTGPEPFGIAFVEALSACLPVVTTALGGALEVVDASCGVLLPVDAAELARALRWLITDPEARRRLGSAGPARAGTLCHPEAQICRLADLLRSLAVFRPGSPTHRNQAHYESSDRPFRHRALAPRQ